MLFEAALLVAGLALGLVGGFTLQDAPGGDDSSGFSADTDAYRTIADNFPRGSVALYDENLRYTLATGSVVPGSDADPATLEGKTVTEAFGESLDDSHRSVYETVFDGEETTFDTEHGGRYYRRHLVPVREDGRVVVGLEMTRDITDLKERERELEASEQRYRTLAENFPRGVVALFDEDLTYTLTDGGVFDHIDQSAADFVGHSVDDVHTKGFLSLHREKFERCLDGERSSFTFSHSERVYRTQIVPVRGADDDVVAGMSLTTDITALKQRERELQHQNERLEEFASIVSHDLRNPLDVAMGRLGIVETDDDQHVEIIREELQRMETIISDMLTLARQGRAVEDPTPVDLGAVAADAWSHVDNDSATLENHLDRTVEADPDRVLQVFENLFRNAVEHSSAGNQTESEDPGEHGVSEVTITLDSTQDGFYVADDGPGIPAGERSKVFEHGYTSNDEGTGLGLAIVENVATAHGWDVTVSESGAGGAQFSFSVDSPIAPGTDGSTPEASR